MSTPSNNSDKQYIAAAYMDLGLRDAVSGLGYAHPAQRPELHATWLLLIAGLWPKP